MIERTKSYKTTDGSVFASLEVAQQHEIENICMGHEGILAGSVPKLAEYLVSKRDALLAILSTKERKARAPKAVKPRKPRTTATIQHSETGS